MWVRAMETYDRVAKVGKGMAETGNGIIWVVPCPVTVATRIIIFLVGDPYKPSFATVTGKPCLIKFLYLPAGR